MVTMLAAFQRKNDDSPMLGRGRDVSCLHAGLSRRTPKLVQNSAIPAVFLRVLKPKCQQNHQDFW